MTYFSRKKDSSYGWYPYQEGGQTMPEPGIDPQAEAQAILEAFAAASPEAQQLIIQTLTQPQ